MNANNWSLDEMTQEVYTVPYSIDECEVRLERLDEPPPRFKVIRMVKKANKDSLYCVQRIHKYKKGTRHVYAEMNVGLQPDATSTRVILYKPRRATKSQKLSIASDIFSILTLIIIVALISRSASDFVKPALLCVVVPGTLSLFYNYRRFVGVRESLHMEIVKTLALESDLKDHLA